MNTSDFFRLDSTQALINLRDKMAASHDLSNEFKEASNWTEERARLQREIQDLDKEYKLVLAKYQALNRYG